ncbi:MAG: apolipoprotein N-acyltransferase, partial [Sphingosinicella sp.]
AGGPDLPARIVQPNIGQHEKWRPHFALRNLRRLGALSRDAQARGPRLLIWPEAAVTEPVLDERTDYRLDTWIVRRAVSRMMRPDDVLLTGGLAVLAADRRRPDGATNSIFAIDGTGRIRARYDKAHLVPFGEYLPMRALLTGLGLSRLAPGDLDFRPGPGPRTLAIPGVGPVGFQLCYEIVFSGEVAERGRRPAFLFNPSNDAWFGAWGPPQHLAQARLRALEEGLPVIRATPTGISAVIDANGRLLHALPLGQEGAIDTRLPPPAPPTLFARLGNIASLGFALLLTGAAIAVRRKAS